MLEFLKEPVQNQIYIVYGLIALVLVLIVVILLIERNGKKKKKRTVRTADYFIKAQKGKSPRAQEIELKPLKVPNPMEDTVQTPIVKVDPVSEMTASSTSFKNPLSVEKEMVEEDTPSASKVEVLPEPKEEKEVVTSPVIPEPIVSAKAVVQQPQQNMQIEAKPKEVEKEEVKPKKSIDEVLAKISPTMQAKRETQKQEEIVYIDEDPELEKTQAQIELARLTEELQKAEANEQAGASENIELTNFEQEQEENAIISIDDLLKRGNTLYDQNEVTQYKDEGNEPINIEELQQRFREKEQQEVWQQVEKKEEKPNKEVILDTFLSSNEKIEKNQEKTFHSTPFISPIYGLEKEKKIEAVEAPAKPVEAIVHENSIALEQTADLDQLDEEIRKTNEFLQVLKELQKNLE